MDREKLCLERCANFVRQKLAGSEGGHDWHHTERVWKTARYIARQEKADRLCVELAALLHDVADAKFHEGDEEIGARTADRFLQELPLEDGRREHIVQIVRHISFKGGQTEAPVRSLEFNIVQDADRLDALGAIGIARCFSYGGFRGRPLYDPRIKPRQEMTPEEYRQNAGPSINHFYEKLLLLKDRMHTATGMEIAAERHRFMEDFLTRFFAEWEGRG